MTPRVSRTCVLTGAVLLGLGALGPLGEARAPPRLYVDGEYEARLPVGSYELVATRGPECRGYQRTVEGRADETTDLTVFLERYADLPAEDIHVANLLEMGNIAVTHFKQPAWGG